MRQFRPTGIIGLNRRDTIEAEIRRLAPRIPRHELGAVLDHAVDSPGLRAAAADRAAWLSLVAFIRHVLTDYDDLLAGGYDVESARHFVAGEIETVLGRWGVRRRLGEADS
jgi:hypothetical protein